MRNKPRLSEPFYERNNNIWCYGQSPSFPKTATKATNKVTDRLAMKMDWALMTSIRIFEADVGGSVPPSEAFCCNIRSRRVFVRSVGFGWSCERAGTMIREVMTERKTA